MRVSRKETEMNQMTVGLKWARLEVTNIRFYEMKVNGGTQTQEMATLKCGCGNVFEMDTEDVDRRLHRACEKCMKMGNNLASGSVTPGEGVDGVPVRTGMPGRPRLGRQRKMMLAVTLDPGLVEWLDQESLDRGVSVSAWVGTLVTEGMKKYTGQVEGS